jgi:hypothetical protein
VEYKIFNKGKDWRIRVWKNFDQKTLINVCRSVYNQHEKYYNKTFNSFGIKESWHSGIDGGERTYSTILAETFHKNGYEVVAEFESLDRQIAKKEGKKIKRKRICDLSLVRGKDEYVVEVKLSYLGLHRGFNNLFERLKKAKFAIRKQFCKVEIEATRIGWVFCKVWTKISKEDAKNTNKNIKDARDTMKRLSKASIIQADALFSWYRPWSSSVVEEYYKTADGFVHANKAEYDIGLFVTGFHIQRGTV